MSNEDKPKLAEQYRKRFAAVPGQGERPNPLEGAGGEISDVTLSNTDLIDKAEQSREELYRIIQEYLNDDAELKKIADKIAYNGKNALAAVAEDNSSYLENNPRMQNYLEVIVRTDGSRPSFMIRNDKVDKLSSPEGVWSRIVDSSGECLLHAIKCVGRINDPEGYHIGTGFLVHDNIIVTNRHVLQAIATKENDGSWHIMKGAYIDFGHEFRAQASLRPRKLEKVLFCPNKYIDPRNIDHSKLDLVLMQVEKATALNKPPRVLTFGLATEWSEDTNYIYTIGYPGNPGLAGLEIYGTLLEQLFKSTFGYKRLAPGMTIRSTSHNQTWTATHDATTLGGNSGSVIVTATNGCVAVGLHYGGTIAAPRENWGHILGHTINSMNSLEQVTLEECLKKNEVVTANTL